LVQQQERHSNSLSPQGPAPAGGDEIDLFDYLLVIWRHRWMIVGLSFVAMAATVAFMLTRPRQYQANATIVPPVGILQKQSIAPGGLGGLGGIGNSMLRSIMDSGSIAGIYVEILESREVADTLIDKFDLMNVYENVENRTETCRQLVKNTTIKTTDEGAVKIAVKDRDPNRAAAIANAYVAELDRQNKRLSAGEATSKRVFLEGRLKELETKLSRIDSIPAREALVQEKLYELLVHECELAKIEEAKSMPTLQVLDEAIVPELPVPRGTVAKGVLAGIVVFVFGVFLSFAREYAAAVKVRDRGQTPPQTAEGQVGGSHPVSLELEVPKPSPSRERKPPAEVGSGAR